MNLKKIKISTLIITFILTFVCHFMYEWFPNLLTSIFFPVNESVWEHMKMLYTAILIGGLIEQIIIKKFNLKTNNTLLTLFIKPAISIPIFLIIYLPFYSFLDENMILNISIMIITLIIVEILSYHLLKMKELNFKNLLSVLIIIITYLVFSILTFYPPKNKLFYDKQENKYGINNYEI